VYKDDFLSRGNSNNHNVDFKPLPPHLLLQLDNKTSDNKNRYLFMVLSLLTTLGVYITIEVGFLFVGHTHEDIDGTYRRMSSNLKSKYIYYSSEMMDTFRAIKEKSISTYIYWQVTTSKFSLMDTSRRGKCTSWTS
jgi:hypothetical protein